MHIYRYIHRYKKTKICLYIHIHLYTHKCMNTHVFIYMKKVKRWRRTSDSSQELAIILRRGAQPSHTSQCQRQMRTVGLHSSSAAPHQRFFGTPHGGVRPFHQKSTCITPIT